MVGYIKLEVPIILIWWSSGVKTWISIQLYFVFSYYVYLFVVFSIWCNRGKDNVGDEVIKPYTPTTLDSDIGYFELVIKVIFNVMYLIFL